MTTSTLPVLLVEVEAVTVERLSPTFVRVEFGSTELADFGVAGPWLDQRIKLVFPNAAGRLPSFAGADESWFTTWLSIPEDERGSMRTYTVRDVLGAGPDTRVVVDFVLHSGGSHGPGGDWAATASAGDRLVLMGPRKDVPYGGIEFLPPADVAELLLVGDETALPAISGILRDLPPDARGTAFVEVPESGDILPLLPPVGVRLEWLPRNGRRRGTALHAAVLAHLDGTPDSGDQVPDEEVDPDLWETPTYSSSGDDLGPGPSAGRHDGLYAWIAGEAKVVTGLRRALVNDVGIDRTHVAFMGYWREGVAMRS